jgi:hypothetical protein
MFAGSVEMSAELVVLQVVSAREGALTAAFHAF